MEVKYPVKYPVKKCLNIRYAVMSIKACEIPCEKKNLNFI